MKIKDLMSVSGLPGLYRLIATKQSGIVAESLETGQKKFLSSRSYQFSPLESIAIYTHTDALPLEDVFVKMKNQPPSEGLAKSDLREYFLEILPDHDQTKVYASDIKKIVAWFHYLTENGYLEDEEAEQSGEEVEPSDEEVEQSDEEVEPSDEEVSTDQDSSEEE